MARSIRSKRSRKMRAVKRVRYGAKELDRLKQTVANDEVKKEINVVMTELSDVISVKNSKDIKEKPNKNTEQEKMDDDGVKHNYNKKTLKDEHGTYPIWMNQRRITKKKKKAKKEKVTKKKK